MIGVLVNYQKVINAAFETLRNRWSDVAWKSVPLGNKIDNSSYDFINRTLNHQKPFEFIIVGDIFWPTGQNICKWAKENNIKCYLLQHGQWRYVANKKKPKFLPYGAFLFGDDIKREVCSWHEWRKVKVESTGTPRYDYCNNDSSSTKYVYYSPPVVSETLNDGRSMGKTDKDVVRILKSMQGIDEDYQLIIHPHYREGMSESFFQELFPDATIAHRTGDAMLLISRARQVLAHRSSTSVLDAIACGKMVTLTNFGGWNYNKSLHHEGYFGEFALESNNVQELRKNLDKRKTLYKNEDYALKAKKYIHLGNASERIRECIIESHLLLGLKSCSLLN